MALQMSLTFILLLNASVEQSCTRTRPEPVRVPGGVVPFTLTERTGGNRMVALGSLTESPRILYAERLLGSRTECDRRPNRCTSSYLLQNLQRWDDNLTTLITAIDTGYLLLHQTPIFHAFYQLDGFEQGFTGADCRDYGAIPRILRICARDYINDVNQSAVLIRKDLSFIAKL